MYFDNTPLVALVRESVSDTALTIEVKYRFLANKVTQGRDWLIGPVRVRATMLV
jgi:hypothetical protein